MTIGEDPASRADALLAEAAAAYDSEAAHEVLRDARDLRDAEWVRCRLTDRLRQASGPIRLDLARQGVRGWVEAVGPDLVVLDDGRERYAAPLGAVLALAGLGPALAEERMAVDRMERVTWAAHLRDLVDEEIRLHRVDGAVLGLRLRAAAADHLDAAALEGGARLTVPYAAIELIRSRSRMGASRRMPESRHTSG